MNLVFVIKQLSKLPTLPWLNTRTYLWAYDNSISFHGLQTIAVKQGKMMSGKVM